MEFHNTRYIIPEDRKSLAIRVSSLDVRRMFMLSSRWNFDAKSVSENNGIGVYAIPLGNFIGGFDWFARILISCNPNPDDVRLVILEYDKSKMIEKDAMDEISLSEANIVKSMTMDEFVVISRISSKDNAMHFVRMFEICKRAAYFFGLGYKKEWVKIMMESYQQMYQRLESFFPSALSVFKESKWGDTEIRFEKLFDYMRKMQGAKLVYIPRI